MKRGLWFLLAPLWCPGCAPASEPTNVDLPLYNALAADASTTGDSGPECEDSDDDTLCDDEELMLGTDPYERDTDGDALDDGLEVHGYTQDGRALDLKALGANPRRKDIFLEIHYMPGWRPLPEAIDDVKRAFLAAPVTNHDGSTGIHLHVEVTQEIPLIEKLAGDPRPELAAMKSTHFDALRAIAFHYGVFGNRFGDDYSSGASMGIGAADFLVTLGGHEVVTDTTARQKQAGTLMHELGHNLGLAHGGKRADGSDPDVPFLPHHFSVMNYTYQFAGVPRDGVDTFDFARTSTRALTESSLDEVAAFSVNKSSPDPELLRITNPRICTWLRTRHRCEEMMALSGSAGRNLDLSRSRGIQTTPVRADLNGNRLSTDTFDALEEEWNALDYRGGGIIGNRNRVRRRDVDLGEPITCQGPLKPEVVTTTEPESPEP